MWLVHKIVVCSGSKSFCNEKKTFYTEFNRLLTYYFLWYNENSESGTQSTSSLPNFKL